MATRCRWPPLSESTRRSARSAMPQSESAIGQCPCRTSTRCQAARASGASGPACRSRRCAALWIVRQAQTPERRNRYQRALPRAGARWDRSGAPRTETRPLPVAKPSVQQRQKRGLSCPGRTKKGDASPRRQCQGHLIDARAAQHRDGQSSDRRCEWRQCIIESEALRHVAHTVERRRVGFDIAIRAVEIAEFVAVSLAC